MTTSNTKESYFLTPRSESVRKKNFTLSSTDVKQTYKSVRTVLTVPDDCLFCGGDFQKNRKQHFSNMITKALYSKYSSSQNYYFTKDINEIMGEARTSAVILFKDLLHYDEQEEYLKRFYHYSEYDFKIKMLTEYYKFHNDIARVFVQPVTNVLNRYHDKKRRLEYIRVTKMLKDEQDGPKDDSGQQLTKRDHKEFIITDRILDDLDLTENEPKKHKRTSSTLKTTQPYLGKTFNQESKITQKKTIMQKNAPAGKTASQAATKPNKDKVQDPTRDISISNTIHDLNLKLGEIISNSRSHFDINYLENNDIQPNDTVSNLNDFLLFMNKNVQSSKMHDIPMIDVKPVPKLTSSAPLTDRPYRPESSNPGTKSKQMIRGDLNSKASDPIVKMISPSVSKSSSKTTKATEKTRERIEERGPSSISLSKQQSSNTSGDKPKGIVNVAKIKNFDEAIKINMQNYQQMTIHTSLPRDHGQDKTVSANTSKTNRAITSRTPGKQAEEKSHESSKQRALYSSASTRAVSRTKTKSTDMYTKALDLLLGPNQVLLATSQVPVKREPAAQPHRSTKSTFNIKVKTPNQVTISQSEKSMGREDSRPDSGLAYQSKIASAKLASDRVYMQTEREVKKIGTLGNLDLQRKEYAQAPLSEREMPKEYVYKPKGLVKSSSKGVIKAAVPMPSEVENIKPESATYLEQKKTGYHKYTKSEGRIKKPENIDKIEIVNNTKILMNGGNSSRTKVGTSSPKRQNYTYNSNNIVNVFLNSNQERRYDRSITLKSERQQYQDGQMNSDSDSITKVFKSRSPNAEAVARFSQTLSKKTTIGTQDSDHKNADYSPLRINPKESLITNQGRMLSDRSPPSLSAGLQRKNAGRSEFEMLRRDLKFENFDSHGKSREKI